LPRVRKGKIIDLSGRLTARVPLEFALEAKKFTRLTKKAQKNKIIKLYTRFKFLLNALPTEQRKAIINIFRENISEKHNAIKRKDAIDYFNPYKDIENFVEELEKVRLKIVG
jgi:hypothetical protein